MSLRRFSATTQRPWRVMLSEHVLYVLVFRFFLIFFLLLRPKTAGEVSFSVVCVCNFVTMFVTMFVY